MTKLDPVPIDETVPFGSVFDEMVAASTARVDRTPGWAESAVVELGEHLRSELADLAASALLALFDDGSDADRTREAGGSQRYWQFVSSQRCAQLHHLRIGFPVLNDLLDLCIEQWIDTTNELVHAVSEARHQIESTLGIPTDDLIVGAASGLGDRHRHGRTVVRVETAAGNRAIYKPRSLQCDQYFLDLWRDFRQRVEDPFPVPRIVDMGSCGVMEFVSRDPTTDSAAYWRRAGELAGLLFLCGTEDLHAENLIASGDQVVPVDLECVDQPRQSADTVDRDDHVDDSVLATGLFPHRLTERWAGPVDLAGLFAGIPERSIGTRLFWQDLGTDAIRRTKQSFTRDRAANTPVTSRGEVVACDLDALRRGLETAWDHGPALATGVEDWGPVRYLRCATHTYGQVRKQMLTIDALQDRSVFEARSRALPCADDTTDADIVEAEAAALRLLDIPLHRSHGADLLVNGGQRIESYFAEAGSDRQARRLARLDHPGRRLQRELVTLAVEQFETPAARQNLPPPGDTRALGDTRAVDTARALGELLLEQRVVTEQGDAWLEVDQGTPMRGVLNATGLYAGSDGIALCFAALASATGDSTWIDASQRALATEPELGEERPWFNNGWSGRAYTRAACAHLLGDDALLDAALGELTPPASISIEPADRLDVLGGWSGVLLALIASCEMGVPVQTQIDELTTSFMAEVEQRLVDPVRTRAVRRMGFGHGTTGIGYALARAGAFTGSSAAIDLACRLADDEEQRIADRNGVPGALEGLGAQKRPRLSWCWGVGGYAMARAHPTWRALGTRSHLDNATELLVALPSDRSHVCCGAAGQLMALLSLCTGGDQSDADVAAGSLAASLAATVENHGPWRFYQETSMVTPGLFWGVAGVAYALLMSARADLIPNVLLLEPVRSTG